MILVIGGSFQGKKEFAQRTFSPSGEAAWCDGAFASWEEIMESSYICSLHLFVKRLLAGEVSPVLAGEVSPGEIDKGDIRPAEKNMGSVSFWEEEGQALLLEKLAAGLSDPSFSRILVTDEVGCGIVPFHREERLWREASGRLNCRIAAAADQVWRVCCGMGTQIK